MKTDTRTCIESPNLKIETQFKGTTKSKDLIETCFPNTLRKLLFHFLYLASYALPRVTFCVIISVFSK